MSATAGWRARVRVSLAPVALTNEATTADGARQRYQVTNAARRVLDPVAPAVVQTSPDGVTWSGASGYTLNRLTATVVFAAAQPAGTQVRLASGSYLPLSTTSGARAYSWTVSAQQVDTSDFDSVSAASGFAGPKITALLDAQGTLDRWYQTDNFFSNALSTATVLVIELMPDRSAAVPDLLVWATLDKEQLSAALAGASDTSVSWQGTRDADGRVVSKP